MDDLVILLILQGLQDLNSKPPDQALWNSLEVVVLDEFIEIDAQALKGDGQVLPEEEVVFDSNDVILIIFVVMIQIF